MDLVRALDNVGKDVTDLFQNGKDIDPKILDFIDTLKDQPDKKKKLSKAAAALVQAMLEN